MTYYTLQQGFVFFISVKTFLALKKSFIPNETRLLKIAYMWHWSLEKATITSCCFKAFNHVAIRRRAC